MSESTYPTTAEQIDRCNETGRTPVVFVHGLWLLPSSWDRWAAVFEAAGYTALTPGWPDDPARACYPLADGRKNPDPAAGIEPG
jgi:non-heme chloroperoxidase